MGFPNYLKNDVLRRRLQYFLTNHEVLNLKSSCVGLDNAIPSKSIVQLSGAVQFSSTSNFSDLKDDVLIIPGSVAVLLKQLSHAQTALVIRSLRLKHRAVLDIIGTFRLDYLRALVVYGSNAHVHLSVSEDYNDDSTLGIPLADFINVLRYASSINFNRNVVNVPLNFLDILSTWKMKNGYIQMGVKLEVLQAMTDDALTRFMQGSNRIVINVIEEGMDLEEGAPLIMAVMERVGVIENKVFYSVESNQNKARPLQIYWSGNIIY